MKRAVVLLLLLFLISCSSLKEAKEGFKDIISVLELITTDSEQAESPALDSIVIKFNTVYWREFPDSLNIEYEKAYNKDGYRVWRIVTPNFRRYQVKKLDTVIYFYKRVLK